MISAAGRNFSFSIIVLAAPLGSAALGPTRLGSSQPAGFPRSADLTPLGPDARPDRQTDWSVGQRSRAPTRNRRPALIRAGGGAHAAFPLGSPVAPPGGVVCRLQCGPIWLGLRRASAAQAHLKSHPPSLASSRAHSAPNKGAFSGPAGPAWPPGALRFRRGRDCSSSVSLI